MSKASCKGKTKNGKDCKNHVSVEGEKFCPSHGGETKASHEEKKKLQKQSKSNSHSPSQSKNKINVPSVMSKNNKNEKKQCSKICPSTGHQCKLSISLQGEKFCPRHGGLTKLGLAMKAPRSPIPWAALHAASVNFVVIEHSFCKCDPRISPCKPMQIMLWLQQLSGIVAGLKGKSSYPFNSALRKWIERAPLQKMNVQEMLLHASRILQVANTRWLRDLMTEIKCEGDVNVEGDIEVEVVELGDDEQQGEEEEEEKEKKGAGEKETVRKNNDVARKEKNVEVENEEEDENDQEEDDEDEMMGDDKGGSKGKEEMSDVEMMDREEEEDNMGDVNQNRGEGENEQDDDEEDEEYLPSQKEPKRNSKKKQKKRVKSQDDFHHDDALNKKTHIADQLLFTTQNSPAI